VMRSCQHESVLIEQHTDSRVQAKPPTETTPAPHRAQSPGTGAPSNDASCNPAPRESESSPCKPRTKFIPAPECKGDPSERGGQRFPAKLRQRFANRIQAEKSRRTRREPWPESRHPPRRPARGGQSMPMRPSMGTAIPRRVACSPLLDLRFDQHSKPSAGGRRQNLWSFHNRGRARSKTGVGQIARVKNGNGRGTRKFDDLARCSDGSGYRGGRGSGLGSDTSPDPGDVKSCEIRPLDLPLSLHRLRTRNR